MTGRTPLWERLGSESSCSDAPSPPRSSPPEAQLEMYRRELQKLHTHTPYSASVRRFLEGKIAEIAAQKQQGNVSTVILSPASPHRRNTPLGPEFHYEWSPASSIQQRSRRQSKSVERLSQPRSTSRGRSQQLSQTQRTNSRDRYSTTNHLGRQRPDPAVHKPYQSGIRRTDRDVLEWVEAQHTWAEKVKARRLLRQEEREREAESRGRPRIHNKTLKLQDLLRKRSRSADSANGSVATARRAVDGYATLQSMDIEEYLLETNVFERLFKVKDTYSARRRSADAASRYSFTPKLCKRSVQLVEAKSDMKQPRRGSKEVSRRARSASPRTRRSSSSRDRSYTKAANKGDESPSEASTAPSRRSMNMRSRDMTDAKFTEPAPFRPQLNRVSLRLATLDGETFNERLARSVESYRRRILECQHDRLGPAAYSPKYDVVSPGRTRKFRKDRLTPGQAGVRFGQANRGLLTEGKTSFFDTSQLALSP